MLVSVKTLRARVVRGRRRPHGLKYSSARAYGCQCEATAYVWGWGDGLWGGATAYVWGGATAYRVGRWPTDWGDSLYVTRDDVGGAIVCGAGLQRTDVGRVDSINQPGSVREWERRGGI